MPTPRVQEQAPAPVVEQLAKQPQNKFKMAVHSKDSDSEGAEEHPENEGEAVTNLLRLAELKKRLRRAHIENFPLRKSLALAQQAQEHVADEHGRQQIIKDERKRIRKEVYAAWKVL